MHRCKKEKIEQEYDLEDEHASVQCRYVYCMCFIWLGHVAQGLTVSDCRFYC